jgi:ketopantoate reductase
LPGLASEVTNEVIADRSISISDVAETAFMGAPATRRHRSSMLHNLASGGRTNVDANPGVIVERARVIGRKAALCATLAAPIRVRERRSGGDGRDGR